MSIFFSSFIDFLETQLPPSPFYRSLFLPCVDVILFFLRTRISEIIVFSVL